MMYFAYGSNLDPVQWRERCPRSPFVAVARITDHRLAFPRRSPIRNCAVASIVPEAGGVVWGVLYQMDEDDLAALDRREGYFADRPEGCRYRRLQLSATRVDGETVNAFTYVAVPSRDPGLPSAAYLSHLIEGARHHQLPRDYVAMIVAMPTLCAMR